MRFKTILISVILLFSANTFATNYDVERSKYTKALKYFKNKDYKNFKKLKSQLINYPLYADLEYKSLHKSKIKKEQKIIKFIEKYKTSYVSRKAYINLIYRLSSKNKYNKLIQNYKNIGSTDLHCLYIRAKIKSNLTTDIDKEIVPIWLSSKSQPKSCDFIFKWFYKKGKLSDELVWQRIKISLDRSNYSLARYLVRFLSNKNKFWANSLLKTYINPNKNIISKSYKNNARYRNTILRYGLKRIARKDYLKAKEYLKKSRSFYGLTDKNYDQLLQVILIEGLKTNQKNIFNDKDMPTDKKNDVHLNKALANYAIYNSEWQRLINYIDKFPNYISEEQKWTYWKGKAFYKLNKKNYNEVLGQLSNERSYYGFLSAHLVNKPLSINNIPYQASKDDLKNLSLRFEIKRIYELFILGKKRAARKELQYLMENSSDINFSSLSLLFHKWGWSDGVILSYGRSKYFDHIEARFPILYEKYFDKYSKTNTEKSLLLGIARKESIFVQYAKSSAGALGIMQVLPRTAYWVLKKSKMKKVSRNYLYNKNMNIYLGSYYFRYLYNKKKSYVEAIASYNAGPSIVRKWRKKNKASEDAWIEFIPYQETRNYTKLVIEYALVYDWVLNKKNTIRISKLIDINK